MKSCTKEFNRIVKKENKKELYFEDGNYYRFLIPSDLDGLEIFFERGEKFLHAMHHILDSKFGIEVHFFNGKINVYLWLEKKQEFYKVLNLLQLLYPTISAQFLNEEKPEFKIYKDDRYYAKYLKIARHETEPFYVAESVDAVSDSVFRILSRVKTQHLKLIVQFLYQSSHIGVSYSQKIDNKYEMAQTREDKINIVSDHKKELANLYHLKNHSWHMAFKTQVSVLTFPESKNDIDLAQTILISLKTAFGLGGNEFVLKPLKFIDIYSHKFKSPGLLRKNALIPKELTRFLIYPSSYLEKLGLAYSYLAVNNKKFSKSIDRPEIEVMVGRNKTKSFETVKFKIKSMEGEHTAVFGETGSGKSTFLINTFMQLVSSDSSLIYLDPAGNSVKEIMSRLTPEMSEKVIYIDPTESPIGSNILSIGVDENKNLVGSRLAEDIITTLRQVSEARTGVEHGLIGTKIEDILKHLILGLADVSQATLIDVSYLLNRAGARETFKKMTKNQLALEFLEDYDNYTPLDLGSTRRLINYVKTNEVLRRMLCTRNPKFSIEQALKDKKIILINGERGMVGESVSTFILSVYLTKIWIYAQFRKEKDKIFVFADEYQEYLNSSFTDMLVTGRKENINLYMATTHPSLIADKMFSAISSNTKNLVLFRLGAEELKRFEDKIDKDLNLFKLVSLTAYFVAGSTGELVELERDEHVISQSSIMKIINNNERFVTEDDSLPSIFVNLESEYFSVFQAFLYLEMCEKKAEFSNLYNYLNDRAVEFGMEEYEKKELFKILDSAIKENLIFKDSGLSYIVTDAGWHRFFKHFNEKEKVYKVLKILSHSGFLWALSYQDKNLKIIAKAEKSETMKLCRNLMFVEFYKENEWETLKLKMQKYQEQGNCAGIVSESDLKMDFKDFNNVFLINLKEMNLTKHYGDLSIILEKIAGYLTVAVEQFQARYTTFTRVLEYSKIIYNLEPEALKTLMFEKELVFETGEKVRVEDKTVKLLEINVEKCRMLGNNKKDVESYLEARNKTGREIFLSNF